jgi:hypothetical protein
VIQPRRHGFGRPRQADGFTDDHGSRLPTDADLLRRKDPDPKIARRSREYPAAHRPGARRGGSDLDLLLTIKRSER